MNISVRNIPRLYAVGLLLVVTAVLYGKVINAPFVYDDHELLLANPLVKSLPAAWVHWPEAKTKLITLWTFAVNYLIGLDDPRGYHFVNIALHFINAVLVYFLTRTIFQTPHLRDQKFDAGLTAVLAALIFLAHPLQTESVSFIWQRSELLSAFFYLLTLICYLQGRLSGRSILYLVALVCFALGFFSKGMIVSLPVLLLFLEDALFDKPKQKWCLPAAAVLGAVAAGVLFLNTPKITTFRSDFFFRGLISYTGTMLEPSHVYTQIVVAARYVFLALLPVKQNLDHDVALIMGWGDPRVIFSLFFLGAVMAAAGVWLWNRNRLMVVGIFWFLVALLPSSLLGGRDPMVEHRLYCPLIGFALFCGAGFAAAWGKNKAVPWLAGGYVVFLCVLTFLRNDLWMSPQALFEDTVKKSPNKSRPAMMLGTVYLTQGNTQAAARMFQHAIQLDPRSAESYNNLGLILLRSGQTMEAENLFEKAVAARKSFVPAYINLGYIALDMGNLDYAAQLFWSGIKYGGESSGFVGLGNLATRAGDAKTAKTRFGQALRADPRNYKAYYGLGQLALYERNAQEAALYFEKALSIKPDFVEAGEQLGRLREMPRRRAGRKFK